MQDTICAISTPHGSGGIAVIRVSGPDAFSIVDKLWSGVAVAEMKSHTAHLGNINDADGEPLDQAVITVFRGPRSYTGLDTVEISVHGSPYIQQQLIEALCSAGARLAEAGEFTRLAHQAGHIDLTQAEAIADLIAAQSRAAHHTALNQLRGSISGKLADLRTQLLEISALLELELDFSEEDVNFASRSHLLDLAVTLRDHISGLLATFRAGNAIRNGIPVAIVGPTNAGKSSLLNTLTGDDRAIVSDIHGTTRDTIQELLTIGDHTYRLIDTAGLRATDDPIERIGIERSRRAHRQAAITILTLDTTAPIPPAIVTDLNDETTDSERYLIIAANKTDLARHSDFDRQLAELQAILQRSYRVKSIEVSTLTGDGINQLTTTLDSIARRLTDTGATDTVITNLRHRQALAQAAESAERIIEGLRSDLPGDLIAQDVRQTIHHLSTITGDIPTPEILQTIFSRFCIGK